MRGLQRSLRHFPVPAHPVRFEGRLSEDSLCLLPGRHGPRTPACEAPAVFLGPSRWLAVNVVLLGLLLGCSPGESAKTKAEDLRRKIAVPVTVSTAVERTVPVQLRAVGNVEAYATVAIRAQVSGELTGVHFKEGQEVKKGDMLFTIDPRPFESRLKQSEANLAKSRAQLLNARKQSERYAAVVKKGYVAEEQYDQVVANASALEATAKADEAAVENARLELRYTSIRSPITGYTGNLMVHAGNVIKAVDNEKPLVTINQVNPINVSFSVPEQNLADVKRSMASRTLEVCVTLAGDNCLPVRGELTFIDNTVNPTTGTIQLKATFSNEAKSLWPGQFVNVSLVLGIETGVVVLPAHAVQTGQDGQYVYVVKEDSTVDYRLVKVGRSMDGEVILEKGVQPGEKVVKEGQLRLAPGSLVKIVEDTEKNGESGRS
jgi:membrane fusion protein, multidrug efflux system